MTKPAGFTQAQIKRAQEVAQKIGMEVAGVTLTREGPRIEFRPLGEPEKPKKRKNGGWG